MKTAASSVLGAVLTIALVTSCKTDVPLVGWSGGPPLPTPTFEGYAATDGDRIYYFGGIVGFGTSPALAETTSRVHVWDSLAGAWTPGPDLPAASAKHHLSVATLGSDIYVLGGFDGILGKPNDGFRPIGTAFVLRAGVWKRLADSPLARGGATAQAIDGRIYVVGGAPTEDVDPYGDLYVYDPAADTWARKAPMPTPREHVASCNVGGKLLAVGGWDKRRSVTTAELYDPVMDVWTRVADMPTRRGGLGAATLDGICHVVGGEDWDLPYPGTFAVNEGFDLRTGRWTTYAPMQEARHGIGVVVLHSALWVVGGGPGQGNSYTARTEQFRR
jgi:N-acetylneuraminic acid mutarotase